MDAIICLVLVTLAGLGKAVADAQAHGSPRLARWFPRWAGPESWRLKYKDGDPDTGPRFWGSTTLFVWTTDCWHFVNMVTWLAADAAVLLVGWPAYRWYAVAAVVARRGTFEPVYRYLRK